MTDRKLRKYEKWLKKELAKGTGLSKRKLFGKKGYQSAMTITIDYLKKQERENIMKARKWIEESFKQEYPEFKDLKFKWEDAK